jgi:hypothetical protein
MIIQDGIPDAQEIDVSNTRVTISELIVSEQETAGTTILYGEGRTFDIPQPWTPETISTAGWYDAADENTITYSVATAISQWDDKSGNGSHATQFSGANQFTRITDGQGRDAIRVVAGTYMDANGLTSLISDYGCECYLVTSLDTFSSKSIFRFSGGVNASSFSFIYGLSDFESYQQVIITDIAYEATNPLGTNYGSAPQAGSPSIFKWSQTLTANGYEGPEPPALGIPGPNGTFTTFRMGTSGTLNLYELIFLVSPQDTATRQKIEGYLAHKWSLTNNLPGLHPYKTEAPTA